MKTSIIKSEGIYSPQRYLEILTDTCFFFSNEAPILTQMNNILKLAGFDTQSYSLTETSRALERKKPIVLVDCTDIDKNSKIVHKYRWFCVPENFKEIE